MRNIPFGLALIDTLDLIEEAFIIPFEAVNSINGGIARRRSCVFADRLCFALRRDYKYP